MVAVHEDLPLSSEAGEHRVFDRYLSYVLPIMRFEADGPPDNDVPVLLLNITGRGRRGGINPTHPFGLKTREGFVVGPLGALLSSPNNRLCFINPGSREETIIVQRVTEADNDRQSSTLPRFSISWQSHKGSLDKIEVDESVVTGYLLFLKDRYRRVIPVRWQRRLANGVQHITRAALQSHTQTASETGQTYGPRHAKQKGQRFTGLLNYLYTVGADQE